MSSSACWSVNGSIGYFLSLVVPPVETCHIISITDRRASHCLMFLGPGPVRQRGTASEPSHTSPMPQECPDQGHRRETLVAVY